MLSTQDLASSSERGMILEPPHHISFPDIDLEYIDRGPPWSYKKNSFSSIDDRSHGRVLLLKNRMF